MQHKSYKKQEPVLHQWLRQQVLPDGVHYTSVVVGAVAAVVVVVDVVVAAAAVAVVVAAAVAVAAVVAAAAAADTAVGQYWSETGSVIQDLWDKQYI